MSNRCNVLINASCMSLTRKPPTSRCKHVKISSHIKNHPPGIMKNLLKGLLDNLTNAEAPTEGGTQREVHIAAALLLIEIGQADSEWTEEETQTIINRISTMFGLNKEEAKELLESALNRSENTVSLHPTLKTINSHFTPEQKQAILTDCWRVAYADGVLDHYEEHQIRRIAELLYLSHSQFIQAKHRACEELES